MARNVRKAWTIAFFQWFVGAGGRKVGSLKRWVRSHVARADISRLWKVWNFKQWFWLSDVKNLFCESGYDERNVLRPQGKKKSEVRGIIYDRVLTPLVLYIYIGYIYNNIYISHIPREFVFDWGSIGFKRACTRARVLVPFVVLVPCCPVSRSRLSRGTKRRTTWPRTSWTGVTRCSVCVSVVYVLFRCLSPSARAHAQTHICCSYLPSNASVGKKLESDPTYS